jgi:hypothetical protein
MKRSTARQFYQQYFSATKASWLARQCAEQRLKMLEELMQWDVTNPTSSR